MRALVVSLAIAVLSATGVQHAQAQATSVQQWQRPQGVSTAVLRIQGPQGAKQFSFAANQPVSLSASMLSGDGTYRWELLYAPEIPASLQALAAQRRAAGDSTLPAGWPQAVPPLYGTLFVKNGAFVDESVVGIEPPQPPIEAPEPNDQVIADDLIVQGSICAGFDCINNENFGADTLRLKENNLRINFTDTSVGTFPSNDWRIIANDSTNGGANYLAIEDSDTGRLPFRVDAAAPTNALRIDSSGRVGLGTDAPVLQLHEVNGNTPALRLDQNASSGFTPQIWDIAGNEANFFVRDVTASSRIPFRIRPGAPTSSIDIEGTGDVGFGIADPSAAVHVRRTAAFGEPLLLVDVPDDSDPTTEERRLSLDADGNLFVGGTITQLSSRFSKENLVAVAGSAVLEQLRKLDIWTWNYRNSDDSDRHLGPVAEDFYARFGLGKSERSVAPADMAGVALAASRALSLEIEQRDRHISELEARIAKLEAALERIDSAKN